MTARHVVYLKERLSVIHMTPGVIALLLAAGFLSSFIDSTVGGGGLISLPAILLVGLPPALSLGTNKLASSLSSLTSSLSFFRSKKVNYRLVRWFFPLSLLGSIAGAETARHLSSDFLRPLVVVLLIAVTLYTIVRKNIGSKSVAHEFRLKVRLILALVAACIGFYDGFFGPGTGSFLIIAFVTAGLDFVQAAGNAKVLNFASNIGALCTFAWLHSVDYGVGLIMGIGMVIGAVIGSQVAIRKGVRFVRPVFIVVTILLIGKQVWSLISG